MTKFLTILFITFLSTIESNGQSIDSLKLSDKEIPEGYSLTKENNCISIQACTFYENPEMYEALIGKLKSKQIQILTVKRTKALLRTLNLKTDLKEKDSWAHFYGVATSQQKNIRKNIMQKATF